MLHDPRCTGLERSRAGRIGDAAVRTQHGCQRAMIRDIEATNPLYQNILLI